VAVEIESRTPEHDHGWLVVIVGIGRTGQISIQHERATRPEDRSALDFGRVGRRSGRGEQSDDERDGQ
jgi:hypothetical protein